MNNGRYGVHAFAYPPLTHGVAGRDHHRQQRQRRACKGDHGSDARGGTAPHAPGGGQRQAHRTAQRQRIGQTAQRHGAQQPCGRAPGIGGGPGRFRMKPDEQAAQQHHHHHAQRVLYG